MIADIQLVTIDKEEFVFIERMEGSMHCYNFEALRKTAKEWQQVWENAEDDYCVMSCPAIKMRVTGSRLLLEMPNSSDRDCRRMFQRRAFLWNGKTFKLTTEQGKP